MTETTQKVPKVWNKGRDKNIPPDAIYVGRPSKWGNPFKIGEQHPADGHRITREESIQLYKDNFATMSKAKDSDGKPILNLVELWGKDLVCWCAPLPCHADILLELANQEAKP